MNGDEKSSVDGDLVLDTNIAIDYLGGVAGFASLTGLLRSCKVYISVITRMELLSYGKMTPESEAVTRSFLTTLRVIPLLDEVEDIATRIRRSSKLKLPDAVIAATAVATKATLITNDGSMSKLQWPEYHTVTSSELLS